MAFSEYMNFNDSLSHFVKESLGIETNAQVDFSNDSDNNLSAQCIFRNRKHQTLCCLQNQLAEP